MIADVLAGRKTVGRIDGTIAYGGHRPTRSFLRRYTGYVEQFGEGSPAFSPETTTGCFCVVAARVPSLKACGGA